MTDTRPAPVRLDDLAAPQYSDDARATLDFLDDYGRTIALDPARLRERASAESGLTAWGDPSFGDRLEVLCRAMREEAGLSAAGAASQYELLTQLLRNRLAIEDLIERHPEIESVAIEQPIIICGLPRTGTTHLHNLLSADPALRYLPYWESLEPVPREGEEPDGRRARCEMALDHVNTVMPHFVRMHEMTVEHAHEEIQLLAIDVSGMLLECIAPMPTWRDHYKATDQTPSYAYLKRVLQALTWLRGGDRWVLKSPQHLEQFRPLLATFPDATFVVTHRDPVAITASTATMIAYTARMAMARPDPVTIGQYWADRTADLLDACVADRELLPPDRSLDVRLDDFVGDELGTVERIYEVAGQPLDGRARAGMAAFVDAHPRGRHGTIVQDLGVLGLDGDRLRARNAEYRDRFKVRDEGLR